MSNRRVQNLTRNIAPLVTMMALCACSTVAIGTTGGDLLGDDTRRLPSASPRAQTPDHGETRRVCRNGRKPAGWLAIDYVDDQEACPTSTKKYGTAVLMRYSSYALGRTMEVCADQPFPRTWEMVRTLPDNASCPRQPGSTSTAPTVMEIRRTR
jgi:hypothetical protein